MALTEYCDLREMRFKERSQFVFDEFVNVRLVHDRLLSPQREEQAIGRREYEDSRFRKVPDCSGKKAPRVGHVLDDFKTHHDVKLASQVEFASILAEKGVLRIVRPGKLDRRIRWIDTNYFPWCRRFDIAGTVARSAAKIE